MFEDQIRVLQTTAYSSRQVLVVQVGFMESGFSVVGDIYFASGRLSPPRRKIYSRNREDK